jgi:hypothetical protein
MRRDHQELMDLKGGGGRLDGTVFPSPAMPQSSEGVFSSEKEVPNMDGAVCLDDWRKEQIRIADSTRDEEQAPRNSFSNPLASTEPGEMAHGVFQRAFFSGIFRSMERAICGGRTILQRLVPSLSGSGALEQALLEVIREFKPPSTPCRAVVTGKPKPLDPPIHEQICLIGREALLNAFHHSQASLIEVEVEYHSRGVRVVIRDNGCGIDADAIKASRTSHWGLLRMEERAKRLHAQLRIRSRRGLGTEVEVAL